MGPVPVPGFEITSCLHFEPHVLDEIDLSLVEDSQVMFSVPIQGAGCPRDAVQLLPPVIPHFHAEELQDAIDLFAGVGAEVGMVDHQEIPPQCFRLLHDVSGGSDPVFQLFVGFLFFRHVRRQFYAVPGAPVEQLHLVVRKRHVQAVPDNMHVLQVVEVGVDFIEVDMRIGLFPAPGCAVCARPQQFPQDPAVEACPFWETKAVDGGIQQNPRAGKRQAICFHVFFKYCQSLPYFCLAGISAKLLILEQARENQVVPGEVQVIPHVDSGIDQYLGNGAGAASSQGADGNDFFHGVLVGFPGTDARCVPGLNDESNCNQSRERG